MLSIVLQSTHGLEFAQEKLIGKLKSRPNLAQKIEQHNKKETAMANALQLIVDSSGTPPDSYYQKGVAYINVSTMAQWNISIGDLISLFN